MGKDSVAAFVIRISSSDELRPTDLPEGPE